MDSGGQPLASLGPAACKDLAAVHGGHPLAEAMAPLADQAAGLVGPFHEPSPAKGKGLAAASAVKGACIARGGALVNGGLKAPPGSPSAKATRHALCGNDQSGQAHRGVVSQAAL